MEKIMIVVLLILFSAGTGFAEIDTDMDFLPQSVATSTNISAGLVNPAGLGYGFVMALRYMHSYYDSTFKGDNGLILATRGNLISVQWLKHTNGISRRKFLLAGGKRVFPGIYWGISYAWFSSSDDLYKKKKIWKLGFLYYPDSPFSAGLVVDDLNAPTFGKLKLNRLYTLGAAIHLSDNKAVFSIDSSVREKGDWDEIESMFRFEFKASKNIYLLAHYRTEGFIQVGAVFQLNHIGLGFSNKFTEDDYLGGSFFYNQEPMQNEY